MPVSRSPQTVREDGSRTTDLPDGVVLRDLVTHTDERGTIVELYDLRWDIHPDPMVYAYQFTIRPGWAKGWGLHREHDDRYVFLEGEMETAFYDERPDSPTYGMAARRVLSGRHRQLIIIPAGVWHAHRNIGAEDVRVVNFPTTPYDHANPDKYLLPLDTDELPIDLGPGWNGW